MSGHKDLIGQKFGRLIVIRHSGINKQGNYQWLCLCDCGNERIVRGGALQNGHTKSCGCLKTERATKHGYLAKGRRSAAYVSWEAMNQRCNNPNHKHYCHYGGRNIKICDRWKSFVYFLEDMGEPPTKNHSLDRIDNDKGYYKENCRWATRKQQMRKTRVNSLITHDNKTQCVSAWCEEIGIAECVIRSRLRRGWSVKRALTSPVQKKEKVNEEG